MPAVKDSVMKKVELKCSRVVQRFRGDQPVGVFSQEVGDEIEVPADEAERMVEAGQAAYIRGGGK